MAHYGVMETCQECGGKYIFCNNLESRAGRLATFSTFPLNEHFKPSDFATSGFYYTGYEDRVKCFSCGRQIEKWIKGEDPKDPNWHHSNCNFDGLLATESRNLTPDDEMPMPGNASNELPRNSPDDSSNPAAVGNTHDSSSGSESDGDIMVSGISFESSFNGMNVDRAQFPEIVFRSHKAVLMKVNLANEEDRKKTFYNWPDQLSKVLANKLAINGFYYLGNLDRVQCFSCKGVLRNWAPDDDIIHFHRKHFPHCWFAECLLENSHDAEKSNVSMSLVCNHKHRDTVATRGHTAQFFPYRRAHFCNAQGKSESQTRSAVIKRLSPGFECWLCGGGLDIWEPYDEPWVEHRPYCLGCEWRIGNKWVEFVWKVKYQNPDVFTTDLTGYDLFSKAAAMKIGLSNMRIIRNIPKSLSFMKNFGIAPKARRHYQSGHSGNRKRDREVSHQDTVVNPPKKQDRRVEPSFALLDESDDIEMPLLVPVDTPNQGRLPQQPERPGFPYLINTNQRLPTFRDTIWRQEMCQAAARAGFFCPGGNRIKCWCCEGEIPNWKGNADPWIEHARRFPRCEFLRRKKGPEFIKEITTVPQTYAGLRRGSPVSSSEEELE